MQSLRYSRTLAIIAILIPVLESGSLLAQVPKTENVQSRSRGNQENLRRPRGMNQHYVSPAGSPDGDGTLEKPWDLQTALYHPSTVQPGETIWVREGTYGNGTTIFYSRLVGTAAAPITVRQYPGERA